jgi:hypothetical protein
LLRFADEPPALVQPNGEEDSITQQKKQKKPAPKRKPENDKPRDPRAGFPGGLVWTGQFPFLSK